MREESFFALNDLSFSNLDKLTKRQSDSFEMRVCELANIAEAIADSASELFCEGMSVYEILSLISEEIGLEASSDEINPSDSMRDRVSAFLLELSDFDRVNLASLLRERFEEKGINVLEGDFLPSAECEEIFTYVKNPLADEAYDVFSQNFSDPRVFYAGNFKEACFAVADGKAGYCILPFEEKGGAPIPTIQSLISALDLKISSLTPVFGFEGTADMKYALVSRGFSVPEIGEDIDRYLEIRISDEDSIDIASLLSVAKYLGISVYRITTVSDNGISYSVVLRDGGRDFTELLIFLTVFAPSYTPIGIYKNLE